MLLQILLISCTILLHILIHRLNDILHYQIIHKCFTELPNQVRCFTTGKQRIYFGN